MLFEELKNKASSLPQLPGIYVMKNSDDVVIYVGKAKKLKNRVSQYFQATSAHTAKTRQMVSQIDHFETIVAASEFEALVLECSLIKRHQPKYNILLKDDKGYPYICIDGNSAYPRLSLENDVSKCTESYGPFGSRGISNSLIDAISETMKLPTCSRKFPQDIGKYRPCLNYHMKRCDGWCQKHMTQADYLERFDQIRRLLKGDYKDVFAEIRSRMLSASDALNFELAASLRDRLNAIEVLNKKQNLVAGAGKTMDIIGCAQVDNLFCFVVLHFLDGNLVDKDYQYINSQESHHDIVSSLMKQYYLARGFAPRYIMIPFAIDDSEMFQEYLAQLYNKKVQIKVPQRGTNAALIALATQNAQEELTAVIEKKEHNDRTLKLLADMIGIKSVKRIESYDVSNLAGTDIVASMVVFQDGKPKRRDFKRFKIKDYDNQDDYASIAQVVRRRFLHYLNQDAGFDILPDLVLIDGGETHAKTAKTVLDELGLAALPVLGMVKDDRHRTRALISPDGLLVNIDGNQSVFSLIGNIQEETHNFAIGYHKKLRSRRLKYSELDKIPNIGEKRKHLLLKVFKSINNIRAASLPELMQYLPANAARAVYDHYNNTEGE